MAAPAPLFAYVLGLADDALILGQRLGEWCGHGPMLEEELALANIGLDHLGWARALYAYAGEIEGAGRDEDALAFLRPERAYRNLLLVEQPNGDFAHTMARQLIYSAFAAPFWAALAASADGRLAGVAGGAEKEARYHLRHAREWVIRLGDGTEESRARMVAALERLWPYSDEMFEMDAATRALAEARIAVDAEALRAPWEAVMEETLAEATLERPRPPYAHSGGRAGRHTEHMGHLIAELQYMQRAYPGLSW